MYATARGKAALAWLASGRTAWAVPSLMPGATLTLTHLLADPGQPSWRRRSPSSSWRNRDIPCRVEARRRLALPALKTVLRRRAGLASHWSTSHTQWWRAVWYGVFTTEHKPAVDQTPLFWVQTTGVLESLHAGPGAVQECNEPGAVACNNSSCRNDTNKDLRGGTRTLNLRPRNF